MTTDAFPSDYHVDAADLATLERYARARGFIDPDERLQSAVKAGEGNMNLTLRLVTAKRSLILKQARPWVEKYPHIAAPSERALTEIAFYETVASRPAVAEAMPRLLASDPERRVLVLEDLGEASDLTTLYAGETLSLEDLEALVRFLKALYPPFVDLRAERPVLENREMRALNHTHLFELPLAENNGLDLDAVTPGLDDAAARLKRDDRYVARVKRLGELYLADGASLLHGDYFPGSWLRTSASAGLRIIDPEFCFLGTPAFDLGVMAAHLYLSRQDESLLERLFETYGDPELVTLARPFAGVEIMRRLLGVAQLPLPYGIETKSALLLKSNELVMSGEAP